jgi:hypothetical protein
MRRRCAGVDAQVSRTVDAQTPRAADARPPRATPSPTDPGARDAARRTRDPLAWKRLQVEDAQVDLTARKVSIGRLALDEPQLALARASDGRINVLQWLSAPAATPPSGTPAAPPTPWQVTLAQVALDGGQVRWRDEAGDASTEPVRLDVSALKVSASALGWPLSSSPSPMQLSARIADPAAERGQRRAQGGTIDWKGRVAIQPLAVQGTLRVERFPLHAIERYIAGGFNASMQRAEAQWRGDCRLRQRPAGLEASAAGDLAARDLHVFSRDPATAVVSPDELLRLAVAQLSGPEGRDGSRRPSRASTSARPVLSDFFSQLVVTEEGRFNLQDVRAPAAPRRRPAASRSAGRSRRRPRPPHRRRHRAPRPASRST